MEEYLGSADCSGESVMRVVKLTGQCESYSYVGGSADSYKSYCSAEPEPWTQFGSAFLLTR